MRGSASAHSARPVSAVFVDTLMPRAILRMRSAEEMATCVKPFARPDEDRRPTLTWPREIPIDGDRPDVADIVQDYSMAGAITGSRALRERRVRSAAHRPPPEVCRTWLNQTEMTLAGEHFVQQDSSMRSAAHFTSSCATSAVPTVANSGCTDQAAALRNGGLNGADGLRAGMMRLAACSI